MNQALSYKKISNTELLLKISYGLLYIVAGSDKFFNLIVNWQQYLNPSIANALGLSSETFMILVGIIEISLGILVLTKWTRAGAYGISVWFLLIVANLLSMWKFLDIAARDVVLAIGAIALAWIAEAQNK